LAGWTAQEDPLFVRRKEDLAAMVFVLLTLSHQAGHRLAVIGFLLIALAGGWLAASGIPRLGIAAARTIGAGIAFACSGLLIAIAIHWGHFG
jgi:hypothetical protein